MRYTAMLVFIVLLFSAGVTDAIAQTAATSPLQIKLVRSKVVLENGVETMQSAAVAQPGEILEEVATYTNTSKSALKSVEATLPIPRNTELVMASVNPTNAKASIDGKNFSNMPLVRKQLQANGVEVEQLVPLSEYRYLRWYPGELKPERPIAFSARFRVVGGQGNPDVSARADQQAIFGAPSITQQTSADKARPDSALTTILGVAVDVLNERAKARNAVPVAPIVPAFRPPLEVTCTTNGNNTTCRER